MRQIEDIGVPPEAGPCDRPPLPDLSMIPEGKRESFHRWAIETGYYEPKPPWVGLRWSDGSESNGRMMLGSAADACVYGTQLCVWHTNPKDEKRVVRVATVMP